MPENDDFPALDEKLAERLSSLDETEALQRADTLRAGLEDYELDEEDARLLEAVTEDPDAPILPSRAARPRRRRPPERRQVGAGQPHHRPPRGRRRGHARRHPRPRHLRGRVERAAASPSSTPAAGSRTPRASTPPSPRRPSSRSTLADAVVFVVDAKVGATATDEQVVRLLRKAGKPVVLVANKVDDAEQEPDAADALDPRSRRAAPGLRAARPRQWRPARRRPRGAAGGPRASRRHEVGGPRRVAILGRPNVGKSSLLNKAAGEERVVVNELAGTTRDPVDELIELGGKLWRFVDTAGIRRRVHLPAGRRLLRLAAHRRRRSRRPRSRSS